MHYLVSASEGPGFATPEETLKVLEDLVLPLFEALMRLEAEKKILAGGLPLGERALCSLWRQRPTKKWTNCCATSPCGACSSGRSWRSRLLPAGPPKNGSTSYAIPRPCPDRQGPPGLSRPPASDRARVRGLTRKPEPAWQRRD